MTPPPSQGGVGCDAAVGSGRLVRRLGEGTPAGHPASAEIEPATNESPAWNLGHRFLLAIGSPRDPPITPERNQWHDAPPARAPLRARANRTRANKKPLVPAALATGATGLEPATSGVTGRRS